MRSAPFLTLVSLLLATLAWGATVSLPNLYSCTPAEIRVHTTGNYTIEGHDSASKQLVFRAHVNAGVKRVTWDAVDLPANATALVTVTDQTGPSPTQTSVVTATALVAPNPVGNYTCLAALKDNDSDGGKKHGQKTLVPTIVGVVAGAFVLLVLLLVGGALWRRKKERAQKIENESVDLSHSYSTQGKVPAGTSYMARLVPGLNIQEARPLPRDRHLESEQEQYASTRRGTQYYHNTPAYDLPPRQRTEPGQEYQTQHQSGEYYHQGYPSVWRGKEAEDPFASKVDLHDPQQQHFQHQPQGQGVYNQNHGEWNNYSESSFMSNKG